MFKANLFQTTVSAFNCDTYHPIQSFMPSIEGNCISGDAECPLPKCQLDGCCSSDPISYFPTATATECLQSCVDNQPGDLYLLFNI